MSLTVKAYLTRVGQKEPEIRRFGIDADVSSNYDYFVNKINAIFPGLTDKKLTFGWKDAENDLVLFSSDEELTEALGYVNDGVFKVYITEKDEPSKEGWERRRGPRVHFGVVCDGCQGPVVGIRYKCEVCPDFDLCEGCKGKGLHQEHSMKSMEKSRGCRFGGEGGHAGPQFPFHCPPPTGFCPPPAGGFCPPQPEGPHGFAGAFAGAGPGHIPPFLRGCDINFDAMPPRMAMKIQRKLFKKWLSEKYGTKWCKKAHKCEKRREKMQRKQEKREKKQKMAMDAPEKDCNVEGASGEKKGKEDTSSSSSSSSDEEEGQSPSEGYLKNVGESVAAMLDPFGIDVEVDIEHKGNRRRFHRHGGWGGWGGFGGGWGGATRDGCQGGWPGFGGHWRGGMGMGRGFGMKGRFGCHQRGTGPWPSYPEHATQYPTPGAPSNPANMETGEGKNEGVGKTSPRDPEWTFIPPPASDVEGATQGVENMHVTSDGGFISATASTSVAASAPPASNVAEALSKMISMGYNDEGGWLTALLTVYNGDVNQALDALQAKK